jgi:tetratricopeptide (TPR) repeat protein
MGSHAKKYLLGILTAALAVAGQDAVEWNRQAAQLYDQARYAEAETLFRRALDAFRAGGDRERVNHAIAMENLAVMLRAQGRFAESEELHLKALPALEAALGEPAVQTVRAISNLAALYWSWGKLDKAESLALRADQLFTVLSPSSPADQASNGQVLASVYLAQHRYPDAKSLLDRLAGAGEPLQVVTGYSNLSAAAMASHEYEQAEAYARQALELAARDLPNGHPVTASALNNLAQACRFQGKYLEAERRYREAIAMLTAALGAAHPDSARAMMNLAAFYHERGREAGAEDLYLRAAEILERTFGKHDAQSLVIRSELADVLRAERRFTEAGKLARRTLREMEAALPEGDPRLARALDNYSRLQAETSKD